MSWTPHGPTFVLRSRRVILGDGGGNDSPTGVPASIHVREGVVERVAAYADLGDVAPGAATESDVVDVGDAIVSPGVVDCHVHINEPGRTEWEGFVTATRAAAAGGTTTVVDMPLNCTPVTTTRAALATKAREARGRCAVDYAFWGGVVPGNAGEIEGMIDDGVCGFKCFLVHSGIDDFPNVGEPDLRLAMPILARRSSVLLVHAEVPGPIDAAAEVQARRRADPRRYETFLRSRPRASENEAIDMVIRLARETGCRVHIVHLSSSDALAALSRARADGVAITCETCPHYLTFSAEEIPDGETPFKCCPPIRERENREKLWSGLRDGTIDMVVSDHSPCTPALKLLDSGDFLDAWGGISSLQLNLAAVWTEARRRGFELGDLARWMSRGPATLAGLARRKGAIAQGLDADFIVWDPDRPFTVDAAMVRHRHPVTPYAGRTLHGTIAATYLRGSCVYRDGTFAEPPAGKELHAS